MFELKVINKEEFAIIHKLKTYQKQLRKRIYLLIITSNNLVIFFCEQFYYNKKR